MTTSIVANPALTEVRRQGGDAVAPSSGCTSRGATVASLIIAVLWTIPTFGLFLTSIRPEEDTLRTGWWTIFVNPTFTLENYEDVLFGRDSLLGPFLNSIAISIPATIFPLVIASLAAYAFAWMKFQGRDVLVRAGLRAADRADPDGARAAALAVLAWLLARRRRAAVRGPPTAPACSRRSGSRTRSSRCRWRSSCCTTSSRRSRPT